MLRYLMTPVLLLAFLSAPAGAADKTAGEHDIMHAGGMTCFPIRTADAPTNGPAGPRFPPHPAATYRSCDQLCADKHAACTATTSTMNPPLSCASVGYVPGSTLCRCCAVER